ncbi:DNA-directed RNA polymerase specialized sigma subunit protein [Winogradskyella psychrotolerans RS-3]|uniref:DNA-directed RNA polymerase specialized sigma subunit protein n=1 Tax=Winogradskyella psychrotolerans RS-3 TaxID=641526 RepID=S7VU02_9FLAO|nr:RNA polymerase sigma factor [Winogradskyella psychrotolerans]EPR73715.1 DNA-directed RNA polymerase specialized sigma subunit protein [Winogradskyella psychrotolerans RS-3]
MKPTNQNIEQLLQLCQSGNQRAQLEIYNRYNKAIRIVKDSFKAEDIMQESFLTAFTKLNTLQDTNLFGAWLKRIVVNNSIGYYNKAVKQNEVSLDSVIYKVEDANGINENEQNSEKVKLILDAMKTLKPNYSLGLSLHLIEGYDYEEICEIMNISYANCRTLISRAKESLRQKLLLKAS